MCWETILWCPSTCCWLELGCRYACCCCCCGACCCCCCCGCLWLSVVVCGCVVACVCVSLCVRVCVAVSGCVAVAVAVTRGFADLKLPPLSLPPSPSPRSLRTTLLARSASPLLLMCRQLSSLSMRQRCGLKSMPRSLFSLTPTSDQGTAVAMCSVCVCVCVCCISLVCVAWSLPLSLSLSRGLSVSCLLLLLSA